MNTIRTAALTILFTLLLAGCGGGGGGGGGSAAVVEPATVGVIITDASIEDWDQALATITSVELIGDDGNDVLFEGSETIDLLQLRDFVEVFEIDENVQPGTYSKIRLRVDQLTLVRLDDDGNIEEERDTRLVANGKIDLNPRGDIDIAPGDVLFITLDFDMDKSLKLTETGNGRLKLRPVIFVDIDTEPGFRGLTRLQGIVERISDDQDGFLLCRTDLIAQPLSHDDDDDDDYDDDDYYDDDDDNRRCVRVATDAETGVFGDDGLPADILTVMEGDAVTVIGRLGRRMDQPEIEPLSYECEYEYEEEYEDGEYEEEYEEECEYDDDDRRDPFVLNAFIIEKGAAGTWNRVAGTAETAIIDDLFDLAVAPAQGFEPDTVIAAQVFPETRLFNPRGEELERNAVQADVRVLVDAVLAISDTDPDVLRTALIIVGDDTPRDSLEGEFLSADGDTLMVATAAGDRCVLAGDATILRITNEDLDIDEIAIGDLESGENLEIFGSEDSVSGCFAADVVVAKPEPTSQEPEA